ncbi:MAG: hypothetical protein ABIN91_19105 [Mucilaginibacter sp.]|uniref:hypothetical protein n=1 Tax=Mucilaginibacter sp. TaxID=1882438 RepID=UPI003262E305
MTTITLALRNAKILNAAQSKFLNRSKLSSRERAALNTLLSSLSFQDNAIEEGLEIIIFDINEMRLHLETWIKLFNSLPNNGDEFFPYASLYDLSDTEYLNGNIGLVAFIPTIFHNEKDGLEKIINIHLRVDGTAAFAFNNPDDAQNFPTLFNFSGSWKEAYLLTVKTLQQGWPQTKFPEELLPLLKR